MESDDQSRVGGRKGLDTGSSVADLAPDPVPAPWKDVRRAGAPSPAPEPSQAPRTISGLLDQGRGLFRRGRLQQAIHVWTRILFLDRNNRAARQAIEKAKSMIAERQRQMDALVLEAARLAAVGDRRGAQRRLVRVLAIDPRHTEGRSLLEKIEEQARRGEARCGTLALAAQPAMERDFPSHRRRVTAAPIVKSNAASPLKMTAFLFSALCLFAAGAVHLHLSWDFLLSDGRSLDSVRTASGASAEIIQTSHGALPGLPSLSELHYFNGSRLFGKRLYREALSELALVGPENPNFDEARGLILRIEGRLLRGVVMAGVTEDSFARNEKGE